MSVGQSEIKSLALDELVVADAVAFERFAAEGDGFHVNVLRSAVRSVDGDCPGRIVDLYFVENR